MAQLKEETYNQNFYYRQGFVKIEKEEKSFLANVTNDGWFVDSFFVKSENQECFDRECREYLESLDFKEKLKRQRGY